MTVRVQEQPFDYGVECNAFSQSARGAGAVVTFAGLVRDDGGTLSSMEIEHYPEMTEKALARIREQAVERWNLNSALIIHRFGKMQAGDHIMMVATAARHRKEAFEAAEFLMDYLKSRAPFWKKELGTSGENWVDARDVDEDALSRWDPND